MHESLFAKQLCVTANAKVGDLIIFNEHRENCIYEGIVTKIERIKDVRGGTLYVEIEGETGWNRNRMVFPSDLIIFE
jgi:hypothetical protein